MKRILLTSVMAAALAACGPKEASQATNAAANAALGEATFNQTCARCHQTGMSGAPEVDDKAAWRPLIAQGMATLYDHSLKGFTGKNGTMPAKGGAIHTDDEVKAAVDYMVSRAK
ncbi:MAG: c-type cytochrome [Elusimicrobiota bacterium]